jgi:hypothetical protein
MFDYRVVRRGREFAIHEVFYDRNGNPTSCTEDALSPATLSVEDLKHELEKMLEATERPSLDYKIFS